MEDELLAFRAAHASTRDAIASCDSPSWALQLAFEEAPDRKAVVGYAALTARRLLPKGTVLDLVRPSPTPLEVVELWSGDKRWMRTRTDYKSLGLAIVVFTVIAVPLKFLVLGTWMAASAVNYSVAMGTGLIAIYALAYVIKALQRREIERRASQLDERLALVLALDQVEKGMLINPGEASRLMPMLRFTLDQLVQGKS